MVVVFACTEEEQDLENFAEILRVAHGPHLSLLATAASHLHAAVAHFKCAEAHVLCEDEGNDQAE